MREGYRIVQFVLIVLCVGSEVVAVQDVGSKPIRLADPIIGTWKLNLAKSKLTPIPAYNWAPPKEQTESYREIDGGRIERTSTTTGIDGSVNSSGKLIWPAQGGTVQIQQIPPGNPPGISFVETLMAPGEWHVTTMLDGKQVMTRHKVISKDGKTMRQTVEIMDPQGKLVEQLEVYDRQ